MAHLTRRHLFTAAATIPWWRFGATQADSSILYDVIVIGGGTAGIPCALFAALNGARVLLVEKSPALGGHAVLVDRSDCRRRDGIPEVVGYQRYATSAL